MADLYRTGHHEEDPYARPAPRTGRHASGLEKEHTPRGELFGCLLVGLLGVVLAAVCVALALRSCSDAF